MKIRGVLAIVVFWISNYLFAQQSISLEIWDRNFEPYQEFSCSLHFFNADKDHLHAE